jgi:hypothetical protein
VLRLDPENVSVPASFLVMAPIPVTLLKMAVPAPSFVSAPEPPTVPDSVVLPAPPTMKAFPPVLIPPVKERRPVSELIRVPEEPIVTAPP